MSIITARVTNIYIGANSLPVDRLNGFELDFVKGEIYPLANIRGGVYIMDGNGETVHVGKTAMADFNEGRHLVFKEPNREFNGHRVVEFTIMKQDSSTDIADPDHASDLLTIIYESGQADQKYA